MSDHLDEVTAIQPVESNNDLKNNAPEIDKMVHDAALAFDESINLSTTSRQLDAIRKSLQDIPEVNQERVLFFKDEIELGKYTIDVQKIAMTLLNEVDLFDL